MDRHRRPPPDQPHGYGAAQRVEVEAATSRGALIIRFGAALLSAARPDG